MPNLQQMAIQSQCNIKGNVNMKLDLLLCPYWFFKDSQGGSQFCLSSVVFSNGILGCVWLVPILKMVNLKDSEFVFD